MIRTGGACMEGLVGRNNAEDKCNPHQPDRRIDVLSPKRPYRFTKVGSLFSDAVIEVGPPQLHLKDSSHRRFGPTAVRAGMFATISQHHSERSRHAAYGSG